MKELKVEIPEGYEIDTEKSTFEKIVFKKKNIINSWDDFNHLVGKRIDDYGKIVDFHGARKNNFLNEKYAKSALALAQISQLLPYYNSKVDWNNDNEVKYCIVKNMDTIEILRFTEVWNLLAFKSIEEAKRFLKHNEQLVKDYFMV